MKFVKGSMWVFVIGLASTMVLSGVNVEIQQGRLMYQSVEAQPRNASAPMKPPRYIPPKFGAPTGRLGGGTRGSEGNQFILAALAPNHVGLTINEQPSLYWYLSQAASHPVELTISAPRAVKALLETRLQPPFQPGIQRVQLADYDVRLARGVPYRWFVSVIADREQRSRDVVASGVIERQDTPPDLKARLTEAKPSHKPSIYAEAGLWYDAISAISELIAAAPQDMELRQHRAALMEQVELKGVAAYDRTTKGQ